MVGSGDEGKPVAYGDVGPLADAFKQLGTQVSRDIALSIDAASCTARLLDDIERKLRESQAG